MQHRAVRSRNTEETGGDSNEELVLKERSFSLLCKWVEVMAPVM